MGRQGYYSADKPLLHPTDPSIKIDINYVPTYPNAVCTGGAAANDPYTADTTGAACITGGGTYTSPTLV